MKVIKKNGYYYLQHSIRKNNKIITKSKYLGLTIPKKLKEIKEEFYRDINKELFEKLDKIKYNFNNEWKKIPNTAKNKELEEISISFTYNTNAIEGSTITLPETREIIIDNIAPSKSLQDIQETKKHSEVFLNALKKKEKITKELILRWHKDMFDESKTDIAGKFRNYLVRVGTYIAPDSNEVIPLMNKLIEFIKTSKLHPVELAGRAHYIFEMIHPFGDGNGRVGRLLMNYILWHNSYPMIIIENKKKKSYYRALEKEENDFADYFIKMYIKVHKNRYYTDK
ncbi:MAG: Fic family protein [Nanoarchaeota archaeon]